MYSVVMVVWASSFIFACPRHHCERLACLESLLSDLSCFNTLSISNRSLNFIDILNNCGHECVRICKVCVACCFLQQHRQCHKYSTVFFLNVNHRKVLFIHSC